MRGGKREGAGRKKAFEGRREVISLTLTDSQWDEIEQSGLSPSAYIRQLMDGNQQLNKATKSKPAPAPITTVAQTAPPLVSESTLTELWERFAVYGDYKEVPAEILADARLALDKQLPTTKTIPQYQSPFDGKRYASMNNLIRSAIPFLIKFKVNEAEQKKDHIRRKKQEAGPKYFDQI